MKERRPLFSIITISFNGEAEIEKTIKSVVNQDCHDYEYILIDGGSVDGTMNIVNRYRKNFSVIVSEKDKGIYDAMNKGWKKATGSYVLYLNCGDEFMDAKVLSLTKKQIKSHGSNEIFYGTTDLAYNNNDSIHSSVTLSLPNLRKGYMPCHQSVFMSLQLIKKVGGFDTTYKIASDFDLLCKTLVYGASVLNIQGIVSRFKKGGVSDDNGENYKERLEIIKKHFGKLAVMKFYIRQLLFVYYRKKFLNIIKLDKITRRVYLKIYARHRE